MLWVVGCGGAVPSAEGETGSDDGGPVTSSSRGSDETGPGGSAQSSTASSGSEASSSGDSGSSPSSSSSSTTEPLPPCDPAEYCTEPTEDGACRHELELPDGMRLYYWANLPLEASPDAGGCHAAIDRVVIVQHGNSRNPWSYCANVLEAASIAGVSETTLVLAPWFPAEEDDPPRGFHVWEPGSSGWKSGDDSITDPALSSFAAMDHIVVDRILERFPSLEEIVVTGHSAGGQFTQRYAVATDVPDAAGAVAMRFVVLNPSSWLYLDPWRWDGVGAPPGVSFELPTGTACDDDYDDFKYGLSNLPAGHYVTDHLAGIPDDYLARDVVYLLGEEDTEQDTDLDTSCPAELQGEHRLERGLVFADYLDARFAGHAHALATVPDVGHSNGGMYTSEVGVSVLFEP